MTTKPEGNQEKLEGFYAECKGKTLMTYTEVVDRLKALEVDAELFEAILEKLDQMGIRTETKPVTYLTGGGFSMMRGGAEYLSTHPDFNCPTETGFIPDSGAPQFGQFVIFMISPQPFSSALSAAVPRPPNSQ